MDNISECQPVPPHPGFVLRDRVLPGLGLSVSQAARELCIARQTLHRVLAGGLSPGHVNLLEGSPGTGKTTIALQFLREGAKAGETGLCITLSETEQELRNGAASHGWSLGDAIHVFELVPPESLLDEAHQQSLLHSSDLELGVRSGSPSARG